LRNLFAIILILISGVSFADEIPPTTSAKSAFADFFQMNIDMVEEIGNRFVDESSNQMPSATTTIKARHLKKYVNFVPTMTVASSPTMPAPVTFTFKASSAWGDSTITIINKHTDFVIKGQCTAQLEKWILKKDNEDKTEIASGALNDQNSFVSDIPGEFKNGLSLTLMVVTSDNQYPVLVELH